MSQPVHAVGQNAPGGHEEGAHEQNPSDRCRVAELAAEEQRDEFADRYPERPDYQRREGDADEEVPPQGSARSGGIRLRRHLWIGDQSDAVGDDARKVGEGLRDHVETESDRAQQ